jgi:TIGR03009 family protein
MNLRSLCLCQTLLLLTSVVSAQQLKGRPPQNPQRSGAKEEFQFSPDELERVNVPSRDTPRRVRQVVPTGGESPITQPDNAQPKIIPCPWDPLKPAEQKSLDQLMLAWEQHSGKVERYRCNFERWEYDPIGGPKDPAQHKTNSTGRILYASPDKGLFEVKTRKAWLKASEAGKKDEYVLTPHEEIGEHWVCDGKSVFQFDAVQHKLIEKPLPAEMQGKAIVDGPLPFLFGAKYDKIKARYWLRLITPPNTKGEHWVEASPKFRADAERFKMIQVIISEQDFLPQAIALFDPTFNPVNRQIRTIFTFKDREYNWDLTLQKIKFWEREFYEPKTPIGWTKVVESFIPEEAQGPAGKVPSAAKPNPLKLPFRLR